MRSVMRILPLAATLCSTAGLTQPQALSIRVLTDFDGGTLGDEWVLTSVFHNGPRHLRLEIQTAPDPGSLLLSGHDGEGAEEQWTLLRPVSEWPVGQSLSLLAEGSTVAQGAHDGVHFGIAAAGSVQPNGRRDMLLMELLNDGRAAAFHFDGNGVCQRHRVVGTDVVLSGPLEFIIHRHEETLYSLAYRCQGEPLRILISEVEVPRPLQAAGMTVYWDHRKQGVPGEVRATQLRLTTEPFPEVPVASITEITQLPRFGYVGEALAFEASPAGARSSYEWDLGEGKAASGRRVTCTFSTPGPRRIQLKVTTRTGRTATTSAEIEIRPTLAADGLSPFRCLAWYWEEGAMRSETFRDITRWTRLLDDALRMGYNGICLIGNHPYPDFVRVPGFPEAQGLSDAELERNRRTLHTVLDLAAERDVRLLMLVYNIFIPPGLARKFGVGVSGDDTPLNRQYNEVAMRAFLDEFPTFGGFVVTVGEAGDAREFCRHTIFKVLRERTPQPFCIVRDQCVTPEEVHGLSQGLTDAFTLSKITEEQFLGEPVGHRATAVAHAAGLPFVRLVSWKPDNLFYGNWRLVRDLVVRGRHPGCAGYLVQGGETDAEWLFREAFGYFMSRPMPPEAEQQAHFVGLVRGRFGEDAPAQLFLETADANGRILPCIKRQYYFRNWGCMPRKGLLLTSFLAMPTYSKWQVPPVIPREARYAEDWLTIPEHVLQYVSSAKVVHTPEQTHRDLLEWARASMAALPALRAYEPGKERAVWTMYLDDIEGTAHLARFYAIKTEAALAWQRAEEAGFPLAETPEEVGRLLDQSLAEYRRVAELRRKAHPDDWAAPFRMMCGGIGYWPQPVPDMGEMERLLELEREEILTRLDRPVPTLPTYPELLQKLEGK